MARKNKKQIVPEKEEKIKACDEQEEQEKDKKGCIQEYQCGKENCKKLYHSYTAFYNHCKKSHQSIFPENSLYNNQIFEGPSKNRGRPRIKKTEAKNEVQIESMKTENELIEFFGTLNRKKKTDELIIYVADPINHLSKAVTNVEDWSDKYKNFLNELLYLNQLVSINDLPDFYDPVEISKYSQKVDSYSYVSIYNYLTDEKRIKASIPVGPSLMRKVLIIWLTRILSQGLLEEVVYTIAQIQLNQGKINSKEYLNGKTQKMQSLIQRYFDCLNVKHTEGKADCSECGMEGEEGEEGMGEDYRQSDEIQGKIQQEQHEEDYEEYEEEVGL